MLLDLQIETANKEKEIREIELLIVKAKARKLNVLADDSLFEVPDSDNAPNYFDL